MTSSSISLEKRSSASSNDNSLDDKIAIATEGIERTDNNIRYITTLLKKTKLQSEENTITICDYIVSLVNESNPVPRYKQTQIQLLCYLSKSCYDEREQRQRKVFSEMTRDDIIAYLNTLRKSESEDPLHRWVGTYNLRRINLIRFFKWLYYPDILPSKARPIPDVVKGIPKPKRKEISTVKPTDLWTEEDDYIFLTYCPSSRDKCYHMVSRDTSCRPSEILNLRIKDVVFGVTKDGTNKQYAIVTVNGKTGTRSIPLFNSIPYLKEWINIHHPQKNNPNAYLIPTLDKRYRKYGHKMTSSMCLYHIYMNYQKEFFPKLLEDNSQQQIPEEDRQKIQALLKKPWNPYIRRHTALTQKAQILPDAGLKQHAGWSGGSQMNLKYVHFYSNESSRLLLEAHGISTIDTDSKDNLTLTNKKLSTPKQCPNCTEVNTVDSKFCVNCKMILTYDAYTQAIEEQQKKDQLLKDLESKINGQQKVQQIQQGLLQIIANTMKVHQETMSDKDIIKSFKKGNPEYDPELNSKQFEQIPIEAKIQITKNIKKEQQHIIQDIILPAVNDISQYALSEPDKAKAAIKKVLENKLFQMHYCWDEHDDEKYINEVSDSNDEMVDVVIEKEEEEKK